MRHGFHPGLAPGVGFTIEIDQQQEQKKTTNRRNIANLVSFHEKHGLHGLEKRFNCPAARVVVK
nr:hypothetical protein [Shimazuella alba]